MVIAFIGVFALGFVSCIGLLVLLDVLDERKKALRPAPRSPVRLVDAYYLSAKQQMLDADLKRRYERARS